MSLAATSANWHYLRDEAWADFNVTWMSALSAGLSLDVALYCLDTVSCFASALLYRGRQIACAIQLQY